MQEDQAATLSFCLGNWPYEKKIHSMVLPDDMSFKISILLFSTVNNTTVHERCVGSSNLDYYNNYCSYIVTDSVYV